MAGDTIHRDGNRWQAIRYTDLENDRRRYDIQRWDLNEGDTLEGMGIDGRRYDKQRWELMAGDTI